MKFSVTVDRDEEGAALNNIKEVLVLCLEVRGKRAVRTRRS